MACLRSQIEIPDDKWDFGKQTPINLGSVEHLKRIGYSDHGIDRPTPQVCGPPTIRLNWTQVRNELLYSLPDTPQDWAAPPTATTHPRKRRARSDRGESSNAPRHDSESSTPTGVTLDDMRGMFESFRVHMHEESVWTRDEILADNIRTREHNTQLRDDIYADARTREHISRMHEAFYAHFDQRFGPMNPPTNDMPPPSNDGSEF